MMYRGVFLGCMGASFALSSWATLAALPPPPQEWWPVVAGLCVAAILLAAGTFVYCWALNHADDEAAEDQGSTVEIPCAMMDENLLRKYYSEDEKD